MLHSMAKINKKIYIFKDIYIWRGRSGGRNLLVSLKIDKENYVIFFFERKPLIKEL